jgi:hypothetical protein
VQADPIEALILDLIEWIGPTPRPYDEVMDAWRTSCPRLTVWEDANERGFVAPRFLDGIGRVVTVTDAGMAHLARHRPR